MWVRRSITLRPDSRSTHLLSQIRKGSLSPPCSTMRGTTASTLVWKMSPSYRVRVTRSRWGLRRLFTKGHIPSINIYPGRHALLMHFDVILKSSISASPAPRAHNDATEARINTAPGRQGQPRNAPNSASTKPASPASIKPQRQSQRLFKKFASIFSLLSCVALMVN